MPTESLDKDKYEKICPITEEVVGTFEVEKGRLARTQICQHDIPLTRQPNETLLHYHDRLFASQVSHIAVIVKVESSNKP